MILVACGTPECDFPLFVRHVSICGGQVFLQILIVLGTTNHAEVVAGGGRGKFGVVLSHTLQTREVGLLGPGFAALDCCAVVMSCRQSSSMNMWKVQKWWPAQEWGL